MVELILLCLLIGEVEVPLVLHHSPAAPVTTVKMVDAVTYNFLMSFASFRSKQPFPCSLSLLNPGDPSPSLPSGDGIVQ